MKETTKNTIRTLKYNKLVKNPAKIWWMHPKLQEMATSKNTKTTVIVIEGWIERDKGLEHTLWERRWIDEEHRNQYRLIRKMMMQQ